MLITKNKELDTFYFSSIESSEIAKDNGMNVETTQVEGDHFTALLKRLNSA